MSTLNISSLQSTFESLLQQEGISVKYSLFLEDDAMLLDNCILINASYSSSEKETLRLTTHEVVHYLQETRGILIGEQPPVFWDSSLTQEQSDYLIELVYQYYLNPEDWRYEIPAWSLQYYPTKVLEIMQS